MKTLAERPFQWHFAAFFPERPIPRKRREPRRPPCRPTGRCGVRRDPLLFLLTLTSGQALEYSHFVQAGLATHQIPTPDLQESRAFGFPGSLADRQLAQGAKGVWKETVAEFVHRHSALTVSNAGKQTIYRIYRALAPMFLLPIIDRRAIFLLNSNEARHILEFRGLEPLTTG